MIEMNKCQWVYNLPSSSIENKAGEWVLGFFILSSIGDIKK
jgi:hypothetical protein